MVATGKADWPDYTRKGIFALVYVRLQKHCSTTSIVMVCFWYKHSQRCRCAVRGGTQLLKRSWGRPVLLRLSRFVALGSVLFLLLKALKPALKFDKYEENMKLERSDINAVVAVWWNIMVSAIYLVSSQMQAARLKNRHKKRLVRSTTFYNVQVVINPVF